MSNDKGGVSAMSAELGKWHAMPTVEKLRLQVEIRGTQSPFGAVAAAALAEIEAALPAMREYARQNPKHHFSADGTEQDPNGAHAWLERNDKPNTQAMRHAAKDER